jgi:hypothetical protein
MIDEPQTDLSVEAFLALRNRFFDSGATPKPYSLRDKLNTQDDPLDEYICKCPSGIMLSVDRAF